MSAFDQLIRPRRGRQKTGTFSISDRLVCVRFGLWLSTSRTPPSEPFDAIDAVRYTFSFITGPLPDHSRLEETCRSFLTTSLSSSDYLDEVLGRLSLLVPCESKSICFKAWS